MQHRDPTGAAEDDPALAPVPGPLPTVISSDDVPLTFYTRPGRSGSTDRYEPGDALVRNYIQTDRFHVGIWEALPGESFWTDCHSDEEVLYVIEGEVTILVLPLGKAVVGRQGDLIRMPAGLEHQSMNRGTRPLKVLFFSPPDAIATRADPRASGLPGVQQADGPGARALLSRYEEQ
ncbi:cupin domain-containing protein [Streptomyces sp. 4F14]|uniref:cupin domain-containing protein n=1 Tax=Streptomyces sp. 4F14 TaxID=3394380 RepID=UPI003A8C5A29